MLAYRNTDFSEELSFFKKKYSFLLRYMPEIIAVKTGLKTAMTIEVHDSDFTTFFEKTKDILSGSRLHFNHYPRKSNHNILVSNKGLLAPFVFEKQNKGNRFSYPRCCIRNFSKMHAHNYHLINSLRHILSDDKHHYNFRMNPFLIRSPFHLYVHIPCSLDCRKTLDYAARLLEKIRKKDISLYSAIVKFNKVPCFYTDVCGTGILLGGGNSGNPAMIQ